MAVILRAVDDPREPDQAPDVARADTDHPAEPQALIADRYELLDRIGQGATGTVYRAIDRTLDRQVAIKLLHPGEHEAADREAQVLAKVAHRNVVTIHDYGQADGRHYLVLELLDGQDLRTWLRGRPSPREIIDVFVDAGMGLGAAHRAGLVHRDFKPSNVILTNEGRVVVIDFGLARNLDSLIGEFEPQRFAEGTLAYMAPERLAGHENDERSDQFAFCVALWEALAGRNPFVGDDPLARYRSIRQGPPRAKLGVAKPFVASLERGMAFEQRDRFATIDELLRELDRPAVEAPRRRGRPVLTAIAVAGTFLVGWGLTPESPIIDEAYSSLDPTAAAAMAILDSAHKRASDGDVDTALSDLLDASELMLSVKAERGSDRFCSFGSGVVKIGDSFLASEAGNQAVMAYSVAIRFSQDCPTLDRDGLKFQRESAQAVAWTKGGQ